MNIFVHINSDFIEVLSQDKFLEMKILLSKGVNNYMISARCFTILAERSAELNEANTSSA